MRAEEIKDADSLQAWLESLPQETEEEREMARRLVGAIAFRAALRVLPIYLRIASLETSVRYGAQLHFCLWGLIAAHAQIAKKLTKPYSWFQHIGQKSEHGVTALLKLANKLSLKEAFAVSYATDAARACLEAPFAFHNPTELLDAVEPAEKASEKIGATSVFWSCLSIDAHDESEAELLEASLGERWIDAQEELWRDTCPQILAQGEGWRFWVEWYENALYGRPQDYDLLTKIALIDPADWDKGADHVNALIQRIVAEHKPKPTPQSPEITDVERSHINLVLAAPEPARQSAEFLQKQFENMELAYRRELGCPNETPPELEPIVTLSRTFGQIAVLLRDVDDRDRLIVELTAKIRTLEANNAQLVESLSGEQGAFMRGVMIGALGNVAGATIIHGFAYVAGPFASEALPSLWEFLKPDPIPPVPTLPPMLDV
ncbi:MAG: hypothetical protein JXQ79_08900 [Rhodobacteraceae bacterium]|nr:hypothetical protein [Paracoccaceae bacterium]